MYLYEAVVGHTRSRRPQRTFGHRIYTWLVELDALPTAIGPFTRFEAADHAGDPQLSIRENLQDFLIARGVDLRGGAVWMLTQARVLGYVFNPLTVYWCYFPDGSPACTVAEVHNTYGERHRYLLIPGPDGYDEVEKDFYVSPFLPQQGRYRLWLPPPGHELALRVELTHADETVFTATMTGYRVTATRRRLLRTVLRYPLMPQRVSAWIRGHGVALWIRGAPRVPHRKQVHREESL